MMDISPKDKVRVVIYGVHSADWMTALDPSAEVWRNISGVDEVFSLPNNEFNELRLTKDRSVKTVLIPLMESHALSCPSGFFTLMPSAENVIKFGLKSEFADYMQKIGRADLCPKHFPSLDSVRYPCVVKRVNLCAGIGVALMRSKTELERLAQEKLWHNQSVVIQEALLNGDEFVTHLVVKNGRILWHTSFAYKLIENEYIRTPSNVINACRTVAEPHVLQAFESCLMPSNYSGPCNIDYKISNEGVLKILEINPRLGGSLMRPDAVDLLTEALACIIHNAQLSS
jgi:biotin carboxylase